MDNNLLKRIDVLCALLEQYALLLIRDKESLANQILPDITKQLVEVFPMIIASYEKVEFTDQREDADYWLNQIERITEVIREKDVFSKIDVLYMETRENLIFYQNMVREMGILI